MGPDEVRHIAEERSLSVYTPTITSIGALTEELIVIRECGYAVDEGEHESVAVAPRETLGPSGRGLVRIALCAAERLFDVGWKPSHTR